MVIIIDSLSQILQVSQRHLKEDREK